MSRVYKSFAVSLEDIRIIRPCDNFSGDCSGDEGTVHTNGPEGEIAAAGQDVTHVQDQAGEILRETEEMVKELLETARLEAEKIKIKANDEARRVVLEGQEKLKQIEEDAFRKGWQEGNKQGRDSAQDEYSSKLQEAQNQVDTAQQERKKIIAGSEDEVVQLAVAVARKVIDRELTSTPEIIVEIVKRSIEKVTDRDEIVIRVHPDNLESTVKAQNEITQSAKGVRKLKVIADASITPGGCVVESASGSVDARLERQLSEIEQALMEVGPNA